MTGVVQEAGVPARPSISIRQRRQEPKASTMSVAHSFGICVPASIAARMIEVPSGTVTLLPSMVSVTIVSDLQRGVPKSVSWISDIRSSYSAACILAGAGPKSSRKCFSALITG
ncbi:hypothetical protein ES703_111311 [subsurface metagenome]